MTNNIIREDIESVTAFLGQEPIPILTQSTQVREFEREWSEWLGVKHSVFVNSGSSANLLTLTALRELYGLGEVIVPALTWVSDIASVIQCGFTPVFVDVDRRTLGMDTAAVVDKLSEQTRAVFLTHILGFNALDDTLLHELEARGIPLIEDVCESHGATFKGGKLGTFGWASNFSFYFAHHMSTIEGGMVSTDDDRLNEMIRMLRSHGMSREAPTDAARQRYAQQYPDLNPDFIFAYPGYNMRGNEISAIIGRSQLRRLDANNELRVENFRLFLDNLDAGLFETDFLTEGNCNYAFVLILKEAYSELCGAVMELLGRCNVEFRRGTSGGGNQLRQPYLQKLVGEGAWADFPVVDHIHFHGFYIGNYPGLEKDKILSLCGMLNELAPYRDSDSE